MSDIYSIKGRIYKIFQTEQKTDKFRKREFVMSVTNTSGSGTYVEYIKMQLVQDRCELLDDLEKGDMCMFKFALTGRKVKKENDEAFYTNIDVVGITTIGKSETIADISSNDVNDMVPLGEKPDNFTEELFGTTTPTDEPDDLPF